MNDDSAHRTPAATDAPTRSAGVRVRAMVRPWWRLPAFWMIVVLFTATANRYVVDRDRSFPEELRSSAVTAAVIVILLLGTSAVLDRRDRRPRG